MAQISFAILLVLAIVALTFAIPAPDHSSSLLKKNMSKNKIHHKRHFGGGMGGPMMGMGGPMMGGGGSSNSFASAMASASSGGFGGGSNAMAMAGAGSNSYGFRKK